MPPSDTDRISSTAGYASEADALAIQYESVTFEEAHRTSLHLFPDRACHILDVGAGTGRDAAALAARGHEVTAVEPTAELRRHGMRLHGRSSIRWIDDALPELRLVAATGDRFEVVLLTAVWMHLDPPEREVAMAQLRQLLRPAGLMMMSLRHGPVPAGRRMFDVSGDETETLAGVHGMTTRFRAERADMLGRADVSWTFLVFERA
jgi:2-polyprenyl-3-methyl-5-hydroxy-6-metoxy-1,4-benzoquinol methylase